MSKLAIAPEADRSVEAVVRDIATAAREASHEMGLADGAARSAALRSAAAAIRRSANAILAENAKDMAFAAEKGLKAAMQDRLLLTPDRIEAMALGLEQVADLPDPVGRTLAEWERPNGLKIARVSVPLGVIGIIYESRPNVTADAGSLCLKSGNAAILRGGSESLHSSAIIVDCLQAGLKEAGLPVKAVQAIPTRDRAAVGAMLRMADLIDIIVPRGGKSLIERVMAESRIPVIAHLEGNCHVYVHEKADPAMARAVILNAKMRRTGVCGAAESLVVDRAVAAGADSRDRRRPVGGGLRDPRRRDGAVDRPAHRARHRRGLGHRISGRDRLAQGGRRAGRRDRPREPPRLAPHRRDRHRRPGGGGPFPCTRRQRDRAAQCIDAVRRRRRIRHGRRDRHLHRQAARPRPGWRGTAHKLQIRRARPRSDAPIARYRCRYTGNVTNFDRGLNCIGLGFYQLLISSANLRHNYLVRWRSANERGLWRDATLA